MADEDTRDAAYWEAEAKKAFAQRDKFQAKLETVEQRLSSETTLSAADKTELERLRKIEADAEEKRRLEEKVIRKFFRLSDEDEEFMLDRVEYQDRAING